MLFEDETINAMHESINLFNDIVNLKHFIQTDMIMFLNKDDLFRLELKKGYTLSVCFSKEANWKGIEWGSKEDNNNNNEIDYDPNKFDNDTKDDDEYFDDCHKAATIFIKERYQEVCNKKNKIIHFHITTATDKEIVKKVFWGYTTYYIKRYFRNCWND